jgi:PAS domain S-box-containing protein
VDKTTQTMGLVASSRELEQQESSSTVHYLSQFAQHNEQFDGDMTNATGKILVAEGSAMVTASLLSVLRDAGYAVTTVGDGIEAVRSAYYQAPDVIVLDVIMPHMNGYQVCRLLKNDPAIAHLPIIMLTPSGSRSDEFWSLQTGADCFLSKKVTPSELLNAIERLLKSQKAPPHITIQPPEPEEILSKVSALLDRKLYSTTVEHIELKAILQNLMEGILTLDAEGFITHANPALCRMLEVTEKELIKYSCMDVLESPASDDALALWDQVVSGQGAASVDSVLHGRSGRRIPVAVSASLLRDYFGNMAGCVYLFRDITRCKEIEVLYGRLRVLNQLKSDLSHMIVHDLRTPLTSLLTGLQTLENLGDLNGDQKEFLDMSIDGGLTLLGMINDLLDIGKMEEGLLQLNCKDIVVADVVKRALGQVSALASTRICGL